MRKRGIVSKIFGILLVFVMLTLMLGGSFGHVRVM